MGGRGSASGIGFKRAPSWAVGVQMSFAAPKVAFTNVYQDRHYKLSGQMRGSGGKLISRQALTQATIVQAEKKGRSIEDALEDVHRVQYATVHAGGYAETFKVVDNMPHDLALPPDHQSLVTAKQLEKAFITPEWEYNVITPQDETEGAIRHYLKGYKDWRIIVRPAHEQVSRYTSSAHTYGMDKPTLTWVSSGQIRELYIPGVDARQFQEQSDLHLLLEKGAPTAAKRISRIMRDYLLIQSLPPEEVKVSYMALDAKGAKVYDGSGLVNRRMVEKMLVSPDMSSEKQAQLQWEIQHTKRIEYTILTPRGQDKGHAIVSDNLLDDNNQPVDFLLPQDTKYDTQDTSGKTVVGINFVHHQDRMRLDDQSLINHRHFFPPEYLAEHVADRSKAFLADIEQGGTPRRQPLNPAQAAGVMKRPLSEFQASGGDVRWSRSLLTSYMNQHIKSIFHVDNQGNERMRLPVAGARYYIKPDAVGRRAGIADLKVPRGHIKIDPEYATAWVNADDWVQMEDSPGNRRQGIADILGGADNDDAVWLYLFSDADAEGEKKVLAWRSPNAPGEYVALKPTEDSHTLYWEQADGEVISYPERRSSQLTPRVDRRPKQTESKIDSTTGGGMGEGEAYSLAAMEKAIDRATNNAGTLGRFVNTLMVYEAIDREVALPAPLEDVIDAMNKTGEDLTPINAWIDERANELRREGIAIPHYLHHRIGQGTAEDETPVLPLQKTNDHWLDDLTLRVKNHVTQMEATRDEMADATTLPDAVLDYTFGRPHAIELGAAYLRHYNRTYNTIRQKRPFGLRSEDYDKLRAAAEAFLDQYPQAHHESILLGAATSLTMRGEGGSDAALWLSGVETARSYKPGIGNKMISGLRKIGVLHELNDPSEPIARNTHTSYEIVDIRGVWRHWHQSEEGGDTIFAPETRREAKNQIKEMAYGALRQMSVTVRQEGQGFMAYSDEGKRLGKVAGRKGQTFTDGQRFKIQHALADNGNLHVVVLLQIYDKKHEEA